MSKKRSSSVPPTEVPLSGATPSLPPVQPSTTSSCALLTSRHPPLSSAASALSRLVSSKGPTSLPTTSLGPSKSTKRLVSSVSFVPAAEPPPPPGGGPSGLIVGSQPYKRQRISDSLLDTILQSIPSTVQSEIAEALAKQPLFQNPPSESSRSKQQAVSGQGASPAQELQEVFNPQLTEPITAGLLVCCACACVICTSLRVVSWYVCAW